MNPQRNLLVLDFETYFDQAYSLIKLSIPEYVHDPRFGVHGLAIRHPGGATEFRSDVPSALADLKAKYGPQLEKTTTVCHNAYFDLYVLEKRFTLQPRFPLDTMLMAYHVHGRKNGVAGGSGKLADLAQRYGLAAKGRLEFMEGVRHPNGQQWEQLRAYSTGDVNLTYELAVRLLPEISRREIEVPLIIHTLKLFTKKAIRVDVAAIDRLVQTAQRSTAELVAASGISRELLASDTQFPAHLSHVLAGKGREMPLKAGRRGQIAATAKGDEPMLAMQDDRDLEVRALARARLAVKSEGSLLARLKKLSRIAAATGGFLPPQLVYCGAHTGRFSGGGGFNIQNLGRDGLAGDVRSLLIPRQGHVFVIGDLAQIEARVLAVLAGEQNLVDTFRQNRDVYSDFASSIFHCPVRKPVPGDSEIVRSDLAAQRHIGKRAVLGLGYSMGSRKFSETLKGDPLARTLFDRGLLTPQFCCEIVETYRQSFHRIRGLWGELEEAFRTTMDGGMPTVGGVRLRWQQDRVHLALPTGRELRYPQPRLDHTPRVIKYLKQDGEEAEFETDRPSIIYGAGRGAKLYGGILTENVVQATARDILADAILELERHGWPVLFHVHDEIVLEVPVDQAEAASLALRSILCTPPSWLPDLPLDAEVRTAINYGK